VKLGTVIRPAVLVVAVACAILTTACASSTTPTTPTTQTTAATTTPATSITCTRFGNTIAELTVANLQTLPHVSASIGGATESGPKLMSVLNALGVASFTSVTVNGSSTQLTLTRDQVTDNVILALEQNGTAKLTGTDIGTAIVNVNTIAIQ
jgi:hypothetical protein